MASLPCTSFSDEEIFNSFYGAVIAWIFLILAPKWRVTHVIAALSAFIYSLLYIGLLGGLIQKKGNLDLGAMSTLHGVQAALADKDTTLLVSNFVSCFWRLNRPARKCSWRLCGSSGVLTNPPYSAQFLCTEASGTLRCTA